MTPFCPSCGAQNSTQELCAHHHMAAGDDWAKGNKIWCDWVHRGVLPERLAPSERADDDFWAQSSDAA